MAAVTVGDLLREAAERAPERVALTEGDGARRRWTYAQLLHEAQRWARALVRAYPPGSRIAVWAPNVPEYQILQYGIALAGMVMVTVNPAFRAAEAGYVLRHCDAAACFAVRDYRGRSPLAMAEQFVDVVHDLEDCADFVATGTPDVELPTVDPDSPALVLYTSGTTGAPKGALLPHRTAVSNVRPAARLIAAGQTSRVVWLATLPMFHLAGCVVAALGTASLLGNLVTVRAFDATCVLRLIAEERVSTTNLVPTLMWALLRDPDFARTDRASLHSVMLGGATIPPHLIQRVDALGIVPIVGYGLTEAPVVAMTAASDPVSDKIETCGRAVDGVEVRVRDPRTGAELQAGEVGELCTRGHTMLGYLDDPDATAAAHTADGWLRTGDLATVDDRGYVRIVGRAKDMIIRGGENIYPREIEDRLVAQPGVLDAAVVGLPDEYYGEVAAAFIRRAPDATVTAAALRDALRSELTGYKVPAKWFFVDSYPLTPSGKVQKFALRDRWQRGEVTEEQV